MSQDLPDWYNELAADIAARIEGVCSLYPREARREVLSNVVRALHARASEIDATDTWLHIALGAADVAAVDMAPVHRSHRESIPTVHASRGDAEDVAQDISLIAIPCGRTASLVAIRAGVHIAWTRFASTLDPFDRALLAVEAAELA